MLPGSYRGVNPVTPEEWLSDHSLEAADIEAVGGQLGPQGLVVPTYTVSGDWVFDIERRFNRDPKYSYSPRGARIGQVLWGLNFARKYCQSSGQTVLVEGWSDALSCRVHGLSCVVSVLGSHPSRVQIAQAKLAAPRIVYWADGDEAGISAAYSLHKRVPGVATVWVVGLDPAEAVKAGYDPIDVVSKAVIGSAMQIGRP